LTTTPRTRLRPRLLTVVVRAEHVRPLAQLTVAGGVSPATLALVVRERVRLVERGGYELFGSDEGTSVADTTRASVAQPVESLQVGVADAVHPAAAGRFILTGGLAIGDTVIVAVSASALEINAAEGVCLAEMVCCGWPEGITGIQDDVQFAVQ